MDSDTHTSRNWEKGALLVGFASLTAAVLFAHGSPPVAYELSIYAGTPLAFWAGTSVAVLVAVVVGLHATDNLRRLALVLGGASTLAIASLPVIRSYYFFGAGDSLTHLGWAKDISAGTLSVVDFLYPGTHSIAVFLADVTGMALPRALLVMVMAFTAVFFTFVPLATWALTRDRRASTLAAFSGLLLLPINNISVFQMPHPTSQAILFAPLILYLLARYLTRADRDDLFVGTPTGALLAVASVAVVLVHPQQAANVLVVFAAVLGLQLLARLWGGRERDHSLLAFQTVFLAVTFFLWAPRHERTSGAISALVNMILRGPQVGSEVTQRAGSLSAVGGSIGTLFLKLFAVSLAFCALAGLLVLVGVLGRIDEDPDAAAFVRYLGLALVPLVGMIGLFFAVSYEGIHFRQLGFVMALVTVLGAVALSRGMAGLSTRVSSRAARAVVGTAVVVALALSVPVAYQSPYVYQSSSHVTEAQMTGYETAFDHRGSHSFVGVRGSGERWSDAVLGVEASRERRSMTLGSLYAGEHPAIGENFTGRYVASHYDDRYLSFTDRVYQQEVGLYDGFRFDESGFRSLDASPRLNRVQANGGVQTYLINATNAAG